LTLQEPFTINSKTAGKLEKMARKSEKNKLKIGMIAVVAMMLERLCSGYSLSKYRKQPEKQKKNS
jgi:transcriptional regulatory protein LevR